VIKKTDPVCTMSLSIRPVEVQPLRGIIRGYIRVSTELQAKNGISLEMQVAKINGYAQYKGYHVADVTLDDGISGRTLEGRPRLQALLNSITRRQHLVVYSVSRLARNLHELLDIEKAIRARGAFLVCLDLDINTNASIGRLIFQIMGSLAEFESNQISERVTDGMHTLMAQQKLITKPKFGWKSVTKGQPCVRDEKAQESIEIIRRYKEDHPEWSVNKITTELNEHKIYCGKAKKWYANRVRVVMIDNFILDDNGSYTSTSEGSGSDSDEPLTPTVPSTPLRIPNPQYDYSSPETPVALTFHAQSP
jgi:site-specific DNA recombinase